MNYFIIILLVIITVIYLNFNHTENFNFMSDLTNMMGGININSFINTANSFGGISNLINSANNYNNCVSELKNWKSAYTTLQNGWNTDKTTFQNQCNTEKTTIQNQLNQCNTEKTTLQTELTELTNKYNNLKNILKNSAGADNFIKTNVIFDDTNNSSQSKPGTFEKDCKIACRKDNDCLGFTYNTPYNKNTTKCLYKKSLNNTPNKYYDKATKTSYYSNIDATKL